MLLGGRVGTQPLERMPEARPANYSGGHMLLISCDRPGKSSRLVLSPPSMLMLSQGLSNS